MASLTTLSEVLWIYTELFKLGKTLKIKSSHCRPAGPVQSKAFYLQPRCNRCHALVKCLFSLLVSLQLLVERITAESKNGSKAWFSCFSQKMPVVNTPYVTCMSTSMPLTCDLYVRDHHWTKYMRQFCSSVTFHS